MNMFSWETHIPRQMNRLMQAGTLWSFCLKLHAHAHDSMCMNSYSSHMCVSAQAVSISLLGGHLEEWLLLKL